MFRNVQRGPPDPIFILKTQADSDTSPDKADLGVGVYRNEEAQYHELQAIKEAKQVLAKLNPGHDYELTTGNVDFVKNASHVVFGAQNEAILSKRVTSVQTISGTGANHLAALFLSRSASFKGKKVYIGTPAWGNYEPLFALAGLPEIVKYRHYDAERASVDFPTVLQNVASAPAGSIFVLQGCCHNPTGADFSRDQWQQLAQAMKKSGAFPFFDIAYQGLGAAPEDDAYGVRLFTELGFESVVCQSFSKNFGLYGERCGALHVVSENADVAANVYDQLRSLIRWEFSSSPAYGARLVDIILTDARLTQLWLDELVTIRKRLVGVREQLYEALVALKTPGDWSALISTKGLFCILPLNQQQCLTLRSKHHVYMPENGRINTAGLNPSNIKKVAAAIDKVVRGGVPSVL